MEIREGGERDFLISKFGKNYEREILFLKNEERIRRQSYKKKFSRKIE